MDGYIKNLNTEFSDKLLESLAKEQLVTDLQISHVKFKLADTNNLSI